MIQRKPYHVLTTGLLRARFSFYNEQFSAYFIQKSSLHPNFPLELVAKIQLILHLVSRMLARQNRMARGHDHTTTLLCKVFACSPKSSRWHRIGSCNSTLVSTTSKPSTWYSQQEPLDKNEKLTANLNSCLVSLMFLMPLTLLFYSDNIKVLFVHSRLEMKNISQCQIITPAFPREANNPLSHEAF